MKKIIIAASLLAVTLTSNAQDVATTTAEPIRSKRGYAILPEAGNWGLSVAANPLLKFAGNLFSSNGSNNGGNPFSGGDGPITITGKYFIDANTAYRLSVGINVGTSTRTVLVADNLNTTAEIKTVEDKSTNSSGQVVLGGGLEKRRGIGRLQGVYGAIAQISIGSGLSNQTNTYGNKFSATNPNPTSTDFGQGARVTSSQNGFGFGVGLMGFIGVEYFFAPKISLGAEYMWGPAFTMVGKGTKETETFDGTATKTTKVETGGQSSLNLGTGTANVSLNFYF